MTLTIGEILKERYRIDGFLSEGGMGAIYQAWDASVDVRVVIKENSFATSPEAQRQFKTEAHILASLKHPNLPRVMDHFVVPRQGQYLVMDFVEGHNLSNVLTRLDRPQTEQEVIPWFEQICRALEYLHSQNPPIIHRDIKPHNIIITPGGNAMLVDFGIAKIYKPNQETTMGAKAVTPGFSPIEQYGEGRTGTYSDVYALGATLYTMLTRSVPPSVTERLNATPIMPPRQLNHQLTPAVERAILKSLEIRPQDRYQSVKEFHTAFVHAGGTRVIGEQIERDKGDRKKYRRDGGQNEAEKKRPWMVWLGGVAIAAILIVAGLLLFSGNNGVQPPLSAGPVIAETIVEIDGRAVEVENGGFQEVTCGTSHRIEIKLLDSDRARIQPEVFSFNWRFVPGDSDNRDKLASSNYALIYQPSCELDNQTIVVEVQGDDKTLYTQSIRFDIAQ